ncbi:MAG TPA: hypothetical protein VNN10_08445 [Dehalococcoidia bacterium]|nr:hypothetical protein [Dehalococcoidia bacterium]
MNRESILSLVRSEPEGVKLLAEVAAGGAVVLAAWSLIGDSLMSDLLYAPITLALAAAYAAALIGFTGSLVHGADRWQVESARQARRLLRTAPPAPGATPGPVSRTPTSFDFWYFVLRLEDEIRLARRQGQRVSIVLMRIDPPGGATDSAIEQINFDVASIAASYAQTMSMPSAIAPLEYAFVMPGAGREDARSRVAPLLGPLGDYWCEFAIAVYPDDATQAEALVQFAQEELDRSLEDEAAS